MTDSKHLTAAFLGAAALGMALAPQAAEAQMSPAVITAVTTAGSGNNDGTLAAPKKAMQDDAQLVRIVTARDVAQASAKGLPRALRGGFYKCTQGLRENSGVTLAQAHAARDCLYSQGPSPLQNAAASLALTLTGAGILLAAGLRRRA